MIFDDVSILLMFINEKCYTARYKRIDTLNMALFDNNIDQLLIKYWSDLRNSVKRILKPRLEQEKNHVTEQIMVNCEVGPRCPQLKFLQNFV